MNHTALLLKKSMVPVIALFFSSFFINGQDASLNDYYAYPLSFGAGYASYSPLTADSRISSERMITGDFRVPIPGLPELQPALRLGYTTIDVNDEIFPARWDHNQFSVMTGASWTNRFSKDFELGLALLSGYNQAVFSNIGEEVFGVSYWDSILEGIIALTPSYNLAIDVRPSLRYRTGSSELTDFNGFSAGISFSAHYRLGNDPDSANAIFRSIRFSAAEIESVFAAMQSYYPENPFGSVNLTNVERTEIRDVVISFHQPGYMDAPSIVAEIPVLGRDETREIGLTGSFNDEIFAVEGIVPLTGQIIAEYSVRGRPARQEYSVSYDLYDKRSIVWDDDRRAGAFITPNDGAIRNYASFLRQSIERNMYPGYYREFQYAMQLYNGLPVIGCVYQSDPVAPFTEMQNNRFAVDSVSLPRETLKRGTGDCDDLTVLYNSLLESLGIPTAFITTPGHIYSAFNTGVAAKDFRFFGSDRSQFIIVDGELWIPVEITMIGNGDFLEAWARGANEWNRYEGDSEKRGFYVTADAQRLFRPVGLRETDLGLYYGDPAVLRQSFISGINDHRSRVLSGIESRIGNSNRLLNVYGIALARFGDYAGARRIFERSMRNDPDFINPVVNLANVAYLTENYPLALESYTRVEQLLENRGELQTPAGQTILINISQTLRELEQFEDSRAYFARAEEIDPAGVAEFAHLGSGGSSRASGVNDSVIFMGEE